MNAFQKAVSWLFQKAVGFPVWTGSTTDIPPGGWGAWDHSGGNSTAMQLAVVYGCARVRGQTLGSMPFHVYREKKSGTRDKAIDHPLYAILHDSPNAYQSSMDFRECLELSFCLYGNAYAEIVRLGNRVASLNFLSPDRVSPQFDRITGKWVYRYTDYSGDMETLPPEKILHVKNFSLDGFCGITPIRRHVIDHAYQAQNYGANFFRNSGRPSGVLSSEQAAPTAEGASAKLRAEWDAVFASSENAGKTAVLWKGLKYQAITMPPDDAQYIQTRQLSTAEIAGAIFGVPLNLLGQPDKSATYASAEQFDIQFVKHTIRPQCVRYEQSFNKRLFPLEPGVFCEFDLDALQRGDSQSQASYFSTLVQNGVMSRDEVRRKLNLPERGNGADDLTVQSNMLDLNQLAKIGQAATGGSIPQVAGDITKAAPAIEMHTHVATPMAEEQMTKVVKEITLAASAVKRTKRIQLIKTADGTTIGADVMEE